MRSAARGQIVEMAGMAAPTRMNADDWLTLAALSVLWGGSFLFYKVLSTELPPLVTVAIRVSLGGGALALSLAARGSPVTPPRRTWLAFLVVGILNNALPFTLFAWGETRVSGGTASILNAMTPVFTLVVSAAFGAERLTRARIAGIGCGLAGVAVLVGPEALLGQDVWGQAACLGAALCYGFGLPLSRRIRGVSPQQMAVGQLIGASVVAVPLAIALYPPASLAMPDLAGVAALLGISLLSTAAALVLFFRLLTRAGATNASLVTLLTPVTAMLLGAALLDETVTVRAIGGMALIATGFAAIDGRLLPRPATSRT